VILVLAERIVNGDIGTDVRPPTRAGDLREFGVSKPTAREVIGALAARGLVTGSLTEPAWRSARRRVEPPRSAPARAQPRTAASVQRTLGDLHDLRMLLEPEIAARAALMATDERLDRIRDALECMGELEDDPTPTSTSTSTSTASWPSRRGMSCSRSCSTRCVSSCG